MTTFRDLLNTLQTLSQQQLDQEVKLIPTGYCTDVPVEIDGFSPFTGEIELTVSKGRIIYEEGSDMPFCGGGVAGCSDTEEWAIPESELVDDLQKDEHLYSPKDVILEADTPYLRIKNRE